MSELEGLQFLRANVIEGKACDLTKPFAFISYAHDEKDTKIVRNVFQKLNEKGYNLWIDTANIPKDEKSWKDAAQAALMNDEKTCKLALFFRSEESLIRKPILDELEMIQVLDHIQRIVTIDIWHKDGMTAKEFGKQLIREMRREDLNIYKEICEYVDADNNAYRIQDVNNRLDELVKELAKELERDGVKSSLSDSTASVSDPAPTPGPVPAPGPVPTPDPDPTPGPTEEGYTYTIFGRPYSAGKREQGKLMYDVFAALTEKYPDKAEALTKRTCVARAENVQNPDTSEAYPTYFRMARKFTVGGQDYYVGISYGFKAKLAEIKGMLKICGEKEDAFVLMDSGADGGLGGNGLTVLAGGNPEDGGQTVSVGGLEDGGQPGEEGNQEDGGQSGTVGGQGGGDQTSTAGGQGDGGQTGTVGGQGDGGQTGTKGGEDGPGVGGDRFEYTLWGALHRAKSLADMMHDSFDALTARYPHKAEAMADDQSLTAVARKQDVDGGKLPQEKLNYFQQKREHTAGGQVYYVSNRYNREQGIEQIERMFLVCEGNMDSFKVVKMPEKKAKGKPRSGKEGIGILL